MASIKDELKKEFLKNKLSDEQFEKLNAVQTSRSSWKITLAFSTAAAIILFLFQFNNKTLEEKIASEIAYNHLKNDKSTFNSSDLKVLSSRLAKLKFQLVYPARLKGYEVLGAKYCSVQGKIAAQIKLRSSRGVISTLYQYKLDESQKNEDDIPSRGVFVDLWKKGDIYMGHAKDKKATNK